MERYIELCEGLRFTVPLLACLLLVAGWWAARGARPRAQVAVTVGLLLVAVLSMLWYTLPHVKMRRYSNPYELFHYALSTRYHAEVGYSDLYNAAVAAADELHVPPVDKVRDLRTGKHVSYEKILRKAPKVRARFSDQRWAEWKTDVGWFAGQVSTRTWAQMLEDKGYNGTPVWTMVGGALADRARGGSPEGMLRLAYIDVGLWLAAFAVVGAAFGPRVAAVVIIMLGAHFVTSFYPLKAAFMRVDWICCLLGAVAMERRGRSALAGALVAYAGLCRVFPFIFAFGPLVALVHAAWTERRLDRGALRFLAALGLTSAALVGASVLATSVGYWREFAERIGEHAEVFSTWRIGFEYVLAGTWDGRAWGGLEFGTFYERYAPLGAAMKGLAMAGCAGLAVRVREPWERLIIGFILMYFLVSPTYYYYVVLLVPTLWLATKPADGRAVAVLLSIFVGSTVSHLVCDRYDRGADTFFVMSIAVLVQILGMAWIILRPAPPPGSAPAPAPPSPAGLAG